MHARKLRDGGRPMARAGGALKRSMQARLGPFLIRAGASGPFRTASVLLVTLLMLFALTATARAQSCIGNCNGDAAVTVDELQIMVNILLGTEPIEACSPGDENGDGEVTVDEIIRAVNYALENEKPEVDFAGACHRPGPDAAQPLVGCTDGTPVRAWRCDDLQHCLDDPATMGVFVGQATVQNGTYAITGVTNCSLSSTYVVTAEVEPETEYRTLRFGQPGAVEQAFRPALSEPETLTGLDLKPTSEATVRLVQENGLVNFGDETFGDVLMAVEEANPPESLVGKTAGEAAQAATQVAQEDENVQQVITTVLRHDVPVSVSIDPKGNVDLYKFTLHKLTPIVLQVTRSSGTITPCLQVVSPANPAVNYATCGDPSARLDLLLAADTYYVYVEDQDDNDIGSYDLSYLRVTPEDAEPLGGDVVSEAIGPLGDIDPYTFALDTCSQVRLQATRASGNVSPCLELRRAGANEPVPDGTACDEGASARLDLSLQAGTYVVLVSDVGNNDEGSYNLQLLTIPGCPTAGTPTPTATPLPPTPTPTASLTVTVENTRTQTPTPTQTTTQRTPTVTQTGCSAGGVIFSNGFESGFGSWTTDNGVWETGDSTIVSAHEGTSVAATVLDGNYPTETDSRLISPRFTVPMVCGDQRIELRFWQTYSYAGGDKGYVQIAVWDGTQWGAWETVATPTAQYTASGWAPISVDLTAYAGQQLRLGFWHVADCCGGNSSGWYLDQIEIWKGVPTLRNPETFENGWGDWYTDSGVWEIGAPTPGPAHEGSSVAATVLDGNYPTETDSRLISPRFTVPTVTGDERVELRFWQTYSYAGGDYAYVQIAVWDGSKWGAWQTVTTAAAPHTSSSWAPVSIDLTDYAGQALQLGFFHVADCCGGNSSGWYLDQIEIWKGVPPF
jgi:hypothetical protein